MRSDQIWRGLVRLANIVGVLWSLLALGILGYYASLGVQLLTD